MAAMAICSPGEHQSEGNGSLIYPNFRITGIEETLNRREEANEKTDLYGDEMVFMVRCVSLPVNDRNGTGTADLSHPGDICAHLDGGKHYSNMDR